LRNQLHKEKNDEVEICSFAELQKEVERQEGDKVVLRGGNPILRVQLDFVGQQTGF
jgi:hypothetical protein